MMTVHRKEFIYGLVLGFASILLLLWSWNTLAVWLHLPQADFVHALAVGVFLTVSGRLWAGSTIRSLHNKGVQHEHYEHSRH